MDDGLAVPQGRANKSSCGRPRPASWSVSRCAKRADWPAQSRERARGRGARGKLAAAARLEVLAERAEKVSRQIAQRVAGEQITDRLVSLADPDARPISKGQARQALRVRLRLPDRRTHRERAPRRPRPDPPGRVPDRSPNDPELLPTIVDELHRLGVRLREAAFYGGFSPEQTNRLLPDSAVYVAGRQQPASRRPQDASPGTASAPKAASATSNAATDCAEHDADATTAPEPRSAGESSPTTSTPSQREPSRPPDTLPDDRHPKATNSQKRPRTARPFHIYSPAFLRGR